MPKTPDEMAEAMIANMKEKTGRDLVGWQKLLSSFSGEKHGEIVKHLKTEHSVSHGFANLIAHKTLQLRSGAHEQTEDELVEAQYSGPKLELKPIYEAIVKVVTKLGKDVVVSPKKTYVSFRRAKQFALIQASTKTRVDLGLVLKDTPVDERLEKSGSFNAMVTHRIRLSSPDEVDRVVAKWLKTAYDAAS